VRACSLWKTSERRKCALGFCHAWDIKNSKWLLSVAVTVQSEKTAEKVALPVSPLQSHPDKKPGRKGGNRTPQRRYPKASCFGQTHQREAPVEGGSPHRPAPGRGENSNTQMCQKANPKYSFPEERIVVCPVSRSAQEIERGKTLQKGKDPEVGR